MVIYHSIRVIIDTEVVFMLHMPYKHHFLYAKPAVFELLLYWLFLYILLLTIVCVAHYNESEVMNLDDTALLSNILLEMRRGTLTLAVLSQLKQPCYGYSLLQQLEKKRTNVEPGTLYPLLRRMEAQGLLESKWDTAESRPRKYYLLSRQGLEMYETLKNEWRRICEEMEGLLKEDEYESLD